jgi:bacterioferritin
MCWNARSGRPDLAHKENVMKGNDKIIQRLNVLLADELTAINQYMVHSEMCANWGYAHLHELNEKRAIGEMKHAEKLIARIIFLEGSPTVSDLNPIHVGPEVPVQLENDRGAEDGAIRMYNEGIKLCLELGDGGTRELLEDILEDEEEHIDEIETQLDQIQQMGVQNYLLGQMS